MATSVIFGFFNLLIVLFGNCISFNIKFCRLENTISAMLFLSIFYFLIELNLKKNQKVASTLYQNNIKALTYATEAIKLFKEFLLKSKKISLSQDFLHK